MNSPTYLDYLEEKTLANSLQMKYGFGKFHKLDKTFGD